MLLNITAVREYLPEFLWTAFYPYGKNLTYEASPTHRGP